MKPRTSLAALAAALLAVTFAAGCSGSEDLGPLGDPTAAQHRIDALIDETAKAITPAVTLTPYIGFIYDEERNVFGNETGYAEVERQSYLEERFAEGKRAVLFDQVEKYWKNQGCTINAKKPDDQQKYISATCPDKAHVMVDAYSDGVVGIKSWVEKTKFRSGGNPFPNTQTPLPTASRHPAGQQDHPYWSH
ncbi:hypothetical protein OU787_18030 [Kitasatospora sp. YST-16]|uniref:hypothetical protein n=1 Tax=Kitasatospora sp. YST-16 TaxID=2998080 RepID=UPI002284AFC2|nr:hypothetical protein [Kitasatospora sp. YST-16]WAL73240.1 hypothetical protein OU787_18030 [Kitasatospora sp. YST-16]WNW39294.1 hypothetical protein RKE32_17990 [Streptomyces sp. Li-HN-5-13]